MTGTDPTERPGEDLGPATVRNRLRARASAVADADGRPLADVLDELAPALMEANEAAVLAGAVERWEAVDDLTDLDEVGEARAAALAESGFETPADVASATPEGLRAVDGIGDRVAERLDVRTGPTVDLRAVAESAGTRVPEGVDHPEHVPPEELFATDGDHYEAFLDLNRKLTARTLLGLDEADVRTVDDLRDAGGEELEAAVAAVGDDHLPPGRTQGDVVATARESADLGRSRPDRSAGTDSEGRERIVRRIEKREESIVEGEQGRGATDGETREEP